MCVYIFASNKVLAPLKTELINLNTCYVILSNTTSMLYVLLIHATLNSPLGANAALDANRVSSLLPADVTNKIGQINAATKSNSQISQQDVDTIRKEEQAKIDALIKQQKEKAAAQAAQPSPQQNPVTQPSSPVPDPSPSQPGNPQSNRPSYKSIFGSSTSLKVHFLLSIAICCFTLIN